MVIRFVTCWMPAIRWPRWVTRSGSVRPLFADVSKVDPGKMAAKSIQKVEVKPILFSEDCLSACCGRRELEVTVWQSKRSL